MLVTLRKAGKDARNLKESGERADAVKSIIPGNLLESQLKNGYIKL